MLNDALGYAKRGIAVFPLAPKSKKPLKGSTGFKEATTDGNQIRKWWLEHPDANIGIALGKISGIVAIDLDGNHGATQEDFDKFPRTPTTSTKNGFHLFYKYPPTGVAPHVVLRSPGGEAQGAAYLRSDGQYVVAVGSTVSHEDGTLWDYEFLSDAGGERSFDDTILAELPSFALNESATTSGGIGDGNTTPAEYGPNTRHDMFVRTATAMYKKGASLAEIRIELYRRNKEDCKPPKPAEEIEPEITGILEWLPVSLPQAEVRKLNNPQQRIAAGEVAEGLATGCVADTSSPTAVEYIIPLGYRGQEYFYTSSDNQTVIALSGSGHTSGGLQQLLPPAYWARTFSGSKAGSTDWTRAGGELMAKCRAVGYFQEDKIRGIGCWLSDDDRLIIHSGDRLIKDGQEFPLSGLDDGYIYQLGARHEIHPSPLTIDECRLFVDACMAPRWRTPGYGRLLAGGLSVLRLCGALRWRPMFWLTGASKSGKSTMMEQVVKPIAGDWATYVQGQATEAGIRQQLKCSSRPVIFDEAETTDENSGKRIKRVVELARQGSSMSGGRIVKGTPMGNALSFTVNSSFLLSSIRVNLTEEADLNRFCLLELDRPDPKAWPAIAATMSQIDEEYGDRLFARYVANWGLLERVRRVFEEAIVGNGEDRRRASQYSIILAGYWLLTSDAEPTIQQAAELAHGLVQQQRMDLEQESDEVLAIDHLLEYPHHTENGTISLRKLITLAQANTEHNETLSMYGLAIHDSALYIHTSHRQLTEIYKNSRWAGIWSGALIRMQDAQRSRVYIGGTQSRCIRIPLVSCLSCG